MPKPLIEIEQNRDWRNWHDTDGVGGVVQQFLTPTNEWADSTARVPGRSFAAGLEGLCEIVRRAEAANVRFRALGSGWSLNSVGCVDGYLVNTSRLTSWSVGSLSPKSIVAIELTDRKPGTFWNEAAPSEYGFYSNVEPAKPHPRWSQAMEQDIGTGEQRPTLHYNGYAEQVAGLYNGSEF